MSEAISFEIASSSSLARLLAMTWMYDFNLYSLQK